MKKILYDSPPLKQNGEVDHWKLFVQQNEKFDRLQKDQTEKLANKIVDKNYNNTKNKNHFTQAAENARDLLGYKYNTTTGTFRNSDGQTADKAEAVKSNELFNKNFQDQKKDDHIASLKKTIPAPRPKLANMPIINRNINLSKNKAAKTNPTIERYRQFKEEKKFNEDFEKDYGDKAIQNYVRSKVHNNRKLGKADYEDLPSSYLIVGEAAKDEAKKKLHATKATEKIKVEPNHLLYSEEIINNNPAPSFPSLEEYMKSRIPTLQDAPGITGLDKVKDFKSVVNFTDQRFPKVSKGIGPYLTGEDD